MLQWWCGLQFKFQTFMADLACGTSYSSINVYFPVNQILENCNPMKFFNVPDLGMKNKLLEYSRQFQKSRVKSLFTLKARSVQSALEGEAQTVCRNYSLVTSSWLPWPKIKNNTIYIRIWTRLWSEISFLKKKRSCLWQKKNDTGKQIWWTHNIVVNFLQPAM